MATLTQIASKKKRTPKPVTKHRKPATGNKKLATGTRTKFPLEEVTKLWNEGKSIEEIAKATGRYKKDAPDPTSGFRGSLNQLRAKGILKIGFRSKPENGKRSAAKKSAAA